MSRDPVAVDEELEKAAAYGQMVEVQLNMVKQRRADIVKSAQCELTMLAEKSELTATEATEVLEKYEKFEAADIGRERDALELSFKQKTTSDETTKAMLLLPLLSAGVGEVVTVRWIPTAAADAAAGGGGVGYPRRRPPS